MDFLKYNGGIGCNNGVQEQISLFFVGQSKTWSKMTWIQTMLDQNKI